MRWLGRLIRLAAVALPGAGLAAVVALPRPPAPPSPPSSCAEAVELTELPEVAELELLGRRWRIGRKLLGARIGFGGAELAVYTTHLCAQCRPEERAGQLEVVLAAIGAASRDGVRPLVLGGDLNLDLQREGGAERPLYARLGAVGLRDSATVTGRPALELCAAAETPDPTCTVGVAVPARPIARRIDYVLAAGPAVPVGHRVVFNPRVDPSQPWVSNHAGVLVELELRRLVEDPARDPG